MLDLTKVARQMHGISQHLTHEAAAASRRLEIALQLLQQAQPRQTELIELRQTWHERLGFTAAEPIEPLETRVAIAPMTEPHTVLATDGSQMAPSHHEIAYCYLINVGLVALHYGQGLHPLLDSQPEVVYRPEDLYVSRQWGIRTEEWMGHRRTVAEAVVLADLAEAICERKQTTPEPTLASGQMALAFQTADEPGLPTLALVDGSLIYRFLETISEVARDRLLPDLLGAWDRLHDLRIPMAGYISASRSGEALNFLRLQRCPHPEPDCQTHCPGAADRAPCQVFDPLRDVALWTQLLQPGQRGPLWRSSAPILERYGDRHHVYFCYVHVGSELARVEFPAWVATDAALLNTTLSLILTQVQKGFGYPVALAEAHNQAVVRGSDRARFFALLEQEMIRAGLRNVGTSYKEARKRGSIA